jgi:hypothetical protein
MDPKPVEDQLTMLHAQLSQRLALHEALHLMVPSFPKPKDVMQLWWMPVQRAQETATAGSAAPPSLPQIARLVDETKCSKRRSAWPFSRPPWQDGPRETHAPWPTLSRARQRHRDGPRREGSAGHNAEPAAHSRPRALRHPEGLAPAPRAPPRSACPQPLEKRCDDRMSKKRTHARPKQPPRPETLRPSFQRT